MEDNDGEVIRQKEDGESKTARLSFRVTVTYIDPGSHSSLPSVSQSEN